MDNPGAPAPTAAPGPGKKELKIVIVGDGGCGKTSLLMVYSQGSFPEHYAPSVFEKYTASVTVGSKEVTLNLYDTAGQEDYDRLRPLSYQNTQLVLICYDVMNPTSYDNVLIKWFPEVTHFCRGIPTVLIGCKTDLRKDKEQLRKLRAAQLEPITYTQPAQLPELCFREERGREACRKPSCLEAVNSPHRPGRHNTPPQFSAEVSPPLCLSLGEAWAGGQDRARSSYSP
ncbi:rho-related GTP-binding protein RhoF isoform X2 [Balaenoptera musculus]|uniref:Rho-related GTP-binding protein RhoF isoform X2 n=1 Tax=Balaenoptera musculus TaxID=9771 RepID=A0A8B8V272_BALMU|nr:rho-related GTP-binding protein RhoF isoform X2 [Balaenoptera musculus]